MADMIETATTEVAYETDYYLWTQQQAAALRATARTHANAPVDWENVAEEIESLGGRDRREVEERVFAICLGLFELQVSVATEKLGEWRQKLRDHRREVEYILADSPSLRVELPSIVDVERAAAAREVRARSEEGSLDTSALEKSIDTLGDWNASEVLDPTFYPTSRLAIRA